MKTLAGFVGIWLLVLGTGFAQDIFIHRLDRIHTAAGEPLLNGSLLIRGGKIVALGDLPIPSTDDIPILDGRGLEATPGIIDAHSHMAVYGSVNEGTDSITCEVRIADSLNPEDPTIHRALAGGCTAAHVMHGSANVVGGQNVTIKLKWKARAEDLPIPDAPRTVKFALGENPKRSNSTPREGERRFPTSRMGVEALLREAFDAARSYEAAWNHHRSEILAGRPSIPPRTDLRKQALLDILKGDLHVHCHCYRADEILMILQIAEEFGFQVKALHHVLEGYKVAPEIAGHGAGASTFADWWGYKMEAYDAVPHNAAILHRAGVVVSIKSDSGDHVRRLNVEAAKAMKYGGLTPLEALQLVTLNPARQLGIDHRTGSLGVGKDGDVALWNGDPLSSTSRCEYTLVEGVVAFNRGEDLASRHPLDRKLQEAGR